MDPHIFAPLELKFAGDAALGEFSGYASVFGIPDAHGDVVMHGAFGESLTEQKSAGRPIPMHVMHAKFGGDGLPVGVWKSVEEDNHGLKVEGKISGMNTDAGRLIYERVKDGALGGLSIGYKVKPNGAVYGKKAGEPKRTLKSLHLGEISLVDQPSCGAARVLEIKGIKAAVAEAVGPDDGDPPEPFDLDGAVENLAAAILLLDRLMGSSVYAPSPGTKDFAVLMDALREAYEDLTGERTPPGLEGWKGALPPLRAVEKMLREEFKLSHAQARAVAERRFKSEPRDEGRAPANAPADSAALTDIRSTLVGFSLPKF